MNILFTDNDGILNGFHYNRANVNNPNAPIFDEKKIPILKQICDETKASVVLSSSIRLQWPYYQRVPENKKVKELLDAFKRYEIPFYGRTPIIEKRINEYSYYETWKEYEIRAYLECHPEVDHFCILDDEFQDLQTFDGYIVTPDFYTPTGIGEGLMPYHVEEIKRVLKKDYWL